MTDPTPLAEQIAREHPQLPGIESCGCGHEIPEGNGYSPDLYTSHIATATEQAVREQVAAEIEAFEPEDRALVHMPDWREAMEDAARIARGATS